jgi:phosphoglycolate phosphatase
LPAFTHIIFDLDGTLIDSFPGIEEAARAACARVLPERAIPDFRWFIGPPIREIFCQALAEPRAAVLDALVTAFREVYDGGAWRRTVLYPGGREALAALQAAGCRCFVLTNKPSHATARILDHLGISGCFAEVVAPGGARGFSGTKIEALLDLKARQQLTPGATLLIGDSVDDAEAAAAGGFHFAAVLFGYGRLPDGERHPVLTRLQSLAEVPWLVEQGQVEPRRGDP